MFTDMPCGVLNPEEGFNVSNLVSLQWFAPKLVARLKHPMILLFGDVGAGKTTFVKAFVRALGSRDLVQSPSFSLVNIYGMPSGEAIYHFDFYRVESLEELYDMGYETYFYDPNAYCIIEWPDKAMSLIPDLHHKIKIQKENQNRYLYFT